MSARRTPGRWWSDGRGAVLAGEPGKDLCSIASVFGGRAGDPAELLANEALLAAAPDLAEALNDLVDAVVTRASAEFLDAFVRQADAVLTRAAPELVRERGGGEIQAKGVRLLAPPAVQALRELVDAVHAQEPAAIARAMRAATALLKGGRHG